MNTQRLKLHVLLALLIAANVVVMSGHNYSHAPSDVTTCELCIQHGGSGNALTPEINTVYITPAPNIFGGNQPPVLATHTTLYHQPSRAPPRFT